MSGKMNRNSKLTSLVPVVALLLLFSVKAAHSTEKNDLQVNVTQSVKTIAATKSAVLITAKSSVSKPTTGRNVSTSNIKTRLSTTPANFPSPVRFGPMVKRLFIVTAVLSLIVGLYFVMKFCRSGKRKTRKYGVIKTPGDSELRPLESDDEDEDDDVTMFNRKN